MPSSSLAFNSRHPLLSDRRRLDKITDVMYAKIHKTLFLETSGPRRLATEERNLAGTGVSADDVLSDALIGLLRYPPEHLRDEWEGLAVRIAYKKAVDALRASRKGLRGTEHRPELHLVSGDAKLQDPDRTSEVALFELLPSDAKDPEAEYLELESTLALRDLAREALDDRAREIFFGIFFDGYSRTELGKRAGLTSQRVGQIFRTALRTLYTHPGYPFMPDSQQQGGTDDE